MDVIDTHFHVWDLERFSYPWLEQVFDTPMGDYSSICATYTLDDYRRDRGDVPVVKGVHVEAACAPRHALDETRWLQELADGDPEGFPHAIVAAADLTAPDVGELLAAHARFPNVRGVRQIVNHHEDARLTFTERDLLHDAAWRRGFAQLAEHRLSFDLQLYPHQMADARRLAEEHGETAIIVNHAGMPIALEGEELARWRAGVDELARAPNVSVKVSGVGMVFHDWTVDRLRPVVDHLLERFGTDRVMLGSNFPVDRLGGDFPAIWRAFEECTAHCSEAERRRVFHDNAVRHYRL